MLERGENWKLLFENNPVAMLVVSKDRMIVDANREMCALYGYARGELVGAPIAVLHLDRDHYEGMTPRFEEAKSGQSIAAFEYPTRARDGSVIWVSLSGARIVFADGDEGVVWSAMDITRRKAAEEALSEREEIFRAIVGQAGEAIVLTDMQTLRFVEFNDAACTMLDYTREEFASLRLPDIQGEKSETEIREDRDRRFREGGFRLETRHRRKGGELIDVLISVRFLTVRGRMFAVSVWRDITDAKAAEAQISRLAHYDVLTGLPNRALFTDRVGHALVRSRRHGRPLAVMFLDLDHFKHINDTLGHGIGDRLLVQLARRLRDVLRAEDTVSRLGGDEFLFLLPECDAAGAAGVAAKIIEVTVRPYTIDQHELTVTASIGISRAPDDGDAFEELLRCADAAMYHAKRAGRNTYRFYDPSMKAGSARMLRLDNGLRRAVDKGELALVYQPQLSFLDDTIVGAEALLRWSHPEFGWVPPTEFIPLAEDNGTIVPIGEWVIRTAVRQASRWIAEGLPPMRVSVNLSAVQFRQANLPQVIAAILAESGLPPPLLELELTESVAMSDPAGAAAMMANLNALGVKLSIDDFGTGYSSLSSLKKFPITRLKIDQSFVQDVGKDPDDEAIVKAIVSLAETLKFHTVAEGVETPEQIAFLRANRCCVMQGYLFSHPLPPDDFVRFVRAHVDAGDQPTKR